MKKTLTKRLLAVAMMASMVVAMALPVSAASYKLTLKIEESVASMKPSYEGNENLKVAESAEAVSTYFADNYSLTDLLAELLLANFGEPEEHESFKADKKGLWVFESDAMGKMIMEGLDAYNNRNRDDQSDPWGTWLAGFESETTDEDEDDAADLLALLQDDATIGDMESNSYSMSYTPDVEDETDPACNNTYTFTLTRAKRPTSSGSTPSTPSTPSDPTPVDPTPSTPADTVVEVPEATTPDEVVTLPVEKVEVSEDAPAIVIETKSETPVKVEIPVAETTPGTVAVIVKEDGTEEIIRDGIVTENGVQVEVSDGDKIVIKDNTKTFNDVTDAHWGKNAVTFVAARGIFAGTGDGSTFSPDVATTRGMIAQVLHNLEYNEEHPHDGHSFPDVGDHHWYDDAVHWAEDHGIVGGYGDGTFKGDKDVTREELVVMLWNYAGKQASVVGDHVLDFNDAEKVSSWALGAMNWALENGILGGKGGKMLDPTGLATRAELAQMIKNFCENF